MKIKFQSLTEKGRWLLATLTLIFTLGIGQMWGADPAMPTECMEFPTNSTYMSALQFNGSSYTNKYYLSPTADTLILNQYLMNQSSETNGKKIKWITYSAKGSSSSNWNAGFGFKGYSYYGVNSQATTRSDRASWYRIKGASKFISYYNGASSSNKCVVSAYEITYVGETPTKSTTASVSRTKQSSSADTIQLILDSSKEYIIELTSTSTSGYKTMEVMFIAPTCTPSTTTFANGNYTVGGSALNLTSLITADATSTGAITFAVKNANGTGASITGSSFTATASGTATVTATQAADATHGICEKSIDATITVVATTPVTSVTVAGPANGYKNNKVIFTATAANATQYEWYVDGTKQGSDSAKLHFTPTEVKTYSIVCKAKNTYNSDWVASTAHSLAVTSLYGGLINFTAKTSSGNIDEDLPAANIGGIIGGTVHQKTQKTGKLGGSGHYVSLQLASGSFQAGDTVRIVVKPEGDNHSVPGTLMLSSLLDNSKIIGSVTGLSAPNSDNITADIILTTSASIIYLSRDGSVTSQNPIVVSMAVIRPMPVKSTAYDLTAVKINGTAISAANLATLKTADAYLLSLDDEYAAGPTVKFARETTKTFEDDSQKATIDTITVTATEVSSKWQAQATIGTITYTVKMAQVTAAKVYYYDGSTKLGEEIVAINGSPVEAGDYDDKTLASFVGWYNNSDLAEEHKIANIAELVVTADVNVYGKWNPVYATSANLEQWVLDYGKSYDAWAQLGAIGYAGSFTNSLDSLDDDPSKTNRNYAYLGFKVKNESGKQIDFRVANGNTVKIKFGHVSTTPKVQYNNTGDYADMTIAEGVYTYAATSADAYISIKAADNATLIFKQIMIGADPAIAEVTLPWKVTYDANGGTCATASAVWSGSALILPSATPAEPADYTFAGWYDEATGGAKKGNAGASYNATDNVTLYAHYAPKEYAINYLPGDHGAGDYVIASAGWGTEYTAIANPFTPETGYVFSGWAVTGAGVSTLADGGSFTMPKNAVTLTALWEDNSKVAMIVETNVKYESLADAIAAADAENVQTIQLLQDIEQANGVAIAKNLILDLNGKTYTCTSGSNVNSRAIKITDGNVTVKNGTIAAVTTANFEGGCYGAFRIEGATANVTLRDLTMTNGRHYGLGIKLVNGHLDMEDCTVTSINGAGGLEVGTGTALVKNCTFTQSGFESAHAWIATCLATCYMGNLEVQGGTYTSEHYVLYVYSSGGAMDVKSGTFEGDIRTAMDRNSYPTAEGSIEIEGGTFQGVGGAEINFSATTAYDEIAISAGTFNTPIENQFCAYGYVPKDNGDGTYGVKPKEGVEIIGVVTTGGTNKTVSGLYQGDATVNLDGDKKIGSGRYIYVTLASGYTFEETDVLVVDVAAKSDLPSDPALEITTGVGNIDGAIWKSIANADYELNLVTIPLTGIAANQTSIGLKRSDHQNTWVNGLKVYRPLKPILTAITINGVDADIDEANKAVAITLPEATTDLGALTVEPTIVWNAAATENSIVVNNGAAWQEGANSYKLTDKDGDATTYTITITLQGEAPAPVITTQPADVAYCAASEPTLTVVATGDELHYAWFKEAGADDEAVGTDAASYTVEAAGTYYVIVTNHVDGKLDKSITSDNAVVTLNVAAAITKQPANKRDIALNSEVTLSVEATNATGYQWYICDDAEKHNASEISGAEAANYVFNCSANAFYYCVVGNACGADIESNVVSVKLEPEGCNVLDGTIPSAAPYIYDNSEWTLYAVTSAGKLDGSSRFKTDAKDFNNNTVNAIEYGRVGMTFAKDVESLTIYATSSSSDRAISSIKVTTDDITTGTPSYADVTFTASAEKLGKKDSSSPYRFVLEANEMLLEAGKNYWLQFSGTVSAFKICYSEALAMPVLPTLSDQELCASAAYETFDATITNEAACEGTVSYKWFSTTDTENPVAETAEFTPTAEGTYYVVVTHAKAGHISRVAQSDELSVAHFDALSLVSYSDDVYQHMGTETTLSVVATGKNVAYVWYTCSNAAGDDAEAIVPAETESSLTIASILEGVHYYKVVITHDCDETTLSHVFKVEGWDQLEQVDVTETTTWNWANAAETMQKIVPAEKDVEQLMANIYDEGKQLKNDAEFNSQALIFSGQEALEKSGSGANTRWFAKGGHIKFNVTVPGIVEVEFSDNGGNNRRIKINDAVSTVASASNTDVKTYKAYVQPGEVTLMGVKNDGTGVDQYIRISKITFTANPTPDYTRNVTNNIGTLCVDHNVLAGGALGATFYQIASRNELYNDKIDFEEVLPNEELKAGEPYIFKSNIGRIDLYYGETVVTEPVAVHGMIGSFANTTLDITEENKSDILYIAQNKLWNCEDLVDDDLEVVANRAYIVMSEVPTYAAAHQNSNGAPRRRVTLGKDAEQVVTGVENLNAAEQPVKLLINGQIFILRGEKMFDATGRLVK